ncbi:MAG: hypothetical protein HYX48_07350 [Chlamydiales bacterium]|nr:hypothetical protein [Chlamydiales bacterium]
MTTTSLPLETRQLVREAMQAVIGAASGAKPSESIDKFFKSELGKTYNKWLVPSAIQERVSALCAGADPTNLSEKIENVFVQFYGDLNISGTQKGCEFPPNVLATTLLNSTVDKSVLKAEMPEFFGVCQVAQTAKCSPEELNNIQHATVGGRRLVLIGKEHGVVTKAANLLHNTLSMLASQKRFALLKASVVRDGAAESAHRKLLKHDDTSWVFGLDTPQNQTVTTFLSVYHTLQVQRLCEAETGPGLLTRVVPHRSLAQLVDNVMNEQLLNLGILRHPKKESEDLEQLKLNESAWISATHSLSAGSLAALSGYYNYISKSQLAEKAKEEIDALPRFKQRVVALAEILQGFFNQLADDQECRELWNEMGEARAFPNECAKIYEKFSMLLIASAATPSWDKTVAIQKIVDSCSGEGILFLFYALSEFALKKHEKNYTRDEQAVIRKMLIVPGETYNPDHMPELFSLLNKKRISIFAKTLLGPLPGVPETAGRVAVLEPKFLAELTRELHRAYGDMPKKEERKAESKSS